MINTVSVSRAETRYNGIIIINGRTILKKNFKFIDKLLLDVIT